MEKNVVPLMDILILTKDKSVEQTMPIINKLCTEIAHIELFSRYFCLDNAAAYINALIYPTAVNRLTNWNDIAPNGFVQTELQKFIEWFNGMFYDGPIGSVREEYIKMLDPVPGYEFEQIRKMIKDDPINSQVINATQTALDIRNSADNRGVPVAMPVGEYISETSGRADNTNPVSYGEIYYENAVNPLLLHLANINDLLITDPARYYRAYKSSVALDKIGDIELMFRSVLAGCYKGFIESCYRAIESKLKLLMIELHKLNYDDLENATTLLIADILVQNDIYKLKYYDADKTTNIDAIALYLDTYTHPIIQSLVKKDPLSKYIMHERLKPSVNLHTTPDNFSDNFQLPMDKAVSDVFDMFQHLSKYVKLNIMSNFAEEKSVIDKINKLEYRLSAELIKDKQIILTRMRVMNHMMGILDKVMWNVHFRTGAYLGSTKLWKKTTETIENYQQLVSMVESKIYDMIDHLNAFNLELDRYRAYGTFKMSIGKTFGDPIVTKFYKQMSFGLIDYYLTIINKILWCISQKKYSKLSLVHQYFSEGHFIVLNRCKKLFDWIKYDYLEPIKAQDRVNQITARKNGLVYDTRDSILAKKIKLSATTGNVKEVLIEFNAIKDMLDKYKVYKVMSKNT